MLAQRNAVISSSIMADPRRKKTRLARFSEGGETDLQRIMREESAKIQAKRAPAPTGAPKKGWLDRVGDAASAAKGAVDSKVQEGQQAVARYLKPTKSINDMVIDRAVAQDGASKPIRQGDASDAMSKGGKIKSKPRGVGIAQRGHGRAGR